MSRPDECAPHADAIAIGDGVRIWPRILADADRGSLQARYEADFRGSYRDEPPPRRDLLPGHAFLTSASLMATRGCHNRCGFCYLATEDLHVPYRMKDPAEIAAELAVSGEPYGVFLDNNLGSNRKYLRALCRALAPLDKIWSAAISIDTTDDPTLVREMALSGCTGVFVGFETLAGENLDAAGKRGPRPEDFSRRVAVLHEHGIQVNGSFVFGFDSDDAGVFDRTLGWIEENRLECATFHILTPYPGTPLFRQLEAEGRLLHRDWSLYDTGHVVFRPRRMSVEELERGYRDCYRDLFSHASIWRRRPRDAAAVPSYLAGAYLYKRANRIWYLLIRSRLTGRVWRPLVEWSRRRHLRFRSRLAAAGVPAAERSPAILPGGV